MKKIFTLLFAVGFLTAAYAQPGTRDTRQTDQRDKEYNQRNDQQNDQWDNSNTYNNGRDNDDRYDNRNSSYGKGMEFRIAQINRKYDFQVQRVKNDFFMRRYEKMRVINSLEMQRRQEIKMLYVRSNNRNGQHDRGFESNHQY